jgi:hypothetical protein
MKHEEVREGAKVKEATFKVWEQGSSQAVPACPSGTDRFGKVKGKVVPVLN